MVTFDVESTPRPETEVLTSPYTETVDDIVTGSSGVEPSVMSSGGQTVQAYKSFISLQPTEQVRFKQSLGILLLTSIRCHIFNLGCIQFC